MIDKEQNKEEEASWAMVHLPTVAYLLTHCLE